MTEEKIEDIESEEKIEKGIRIIKDIKEDKELTCVIHEDGVIEHGEEAQQRLLVNAYEYGTAIGRISALAAVFNIKESDLKEKDIPLVKLPI